MRHFVTRSGRAAALSLFGVVAMPSFGLACTYGYCFGAVAAGDKGIVGRATSMATAPDAYDWAVRACDGKCDLVETFVDGCGVIVATRDYQRFSGFGETRGAAFVDAAANCDAAGEKQCRTLVWACTQK